MTERRCFVYIDRDTRKVLGRIVESDREVKTQAWYLGRMIEAHPDVVRGMVTKKFTEWAAAYAVSPEHVSIEFAPLPDQMADDG